MWVGVFRVLAYRRFFLEKASRRGLSSYCEFQILVIKIQKSAHLLRLPLPHLFRLWTTFDKS